MWPVMFNAVGGSSIYYGAEWPRLLPSDFRVKTLDGVADDWPISYDDLKPYHDEVDEFIGVSGVGGDTAYPEGLDYPLPPHPLGKPGMKAAAGRQQARLALVAGHQRHRQPEEQDPRAVRPLGCLRVGLPAGRQGLLRPDLHAASAASRRRGASPVRGSARSSPTSGGLATGAEWIDRDGNVRVPARPRSGAVRQRHRHPAAAAALRQRPAPRRPGQLIGPGRPQPHAAPQLHAHWATTTKNLESWRGPAGQLIHSMQFYETDKSRGFVRGAKLHALPTPGPLNAIEAHRELDFDDLWGPAIHDVARSARNGILWAANTEDLPEEHNRVTLSTETGRPRRAPRPEDRIPDQRQHPQDC